MNVCCTLHFHHMTVEWGQGRTDRHIQTTASVEAHLRTEEEGQPGGGPELEEVRERALFFLCAPTPAPSWLLIKEDGSGMTRPTSHMGSGFSSSRGGDSGRGYGRSIGEELRAWPWQGREGSWCQLPATVVQELQQLSDCRRKKPMRAMGHSWRDVCSSLGFSGGHHVPEKGWCEQI